MNTTVKDVMTTHVVAVRLNATYKDMATRLREFRVSAFPVLDDDNKVIGVVSEADLLTKEALEYSAPGLMGGILHGRERAKAAAVIAADLMTRPAVTIGPRRAGLARGRLMYSRKVKRLPVVDDDGRLVGIVSRADVLSVYSRPDAEIRHDIIENVIVGTVLTDPARFIRHGQGRRGDGRGQAGERERRPGHDRGDPPRRRRRRGARPAWLPA